MKNSNVKYICENCGTKAEMDKEVTTRYWVAYKNKCQECGGKIVTKIERVEE
jgi:DNA-directed RNA polymerase subunit RPC12/RpoP